MKRQTRLFPKAVVALERLGENIKLARRRRGITSALMAERADMSLLTLRAIERGSPKVAMGNYMSVLFCLGMQDDMAQVAAADLQGRDIQDARLLRRYHRSLISAETKSTACRHASARRSFGE